MTKNGKNIRVRIEIGNPDSKPIIIEEVVDEYDLDTIIDGDRVKRTLQIWNKKHRKTPMPNNKDPEI